MKRRDFFRLSLGGSAVAAFATLGTQNNLMAEIQEKARPLNLKVTDLKTFLVHAGGDENYVFVKIYTNKGIVGLGEGTIPSKGLTMAQAIMEHKRYLMGKDPTEIERHWQAMFRGPRYRGGPVIMSAISAVEIALWDILGQALGQPIWQLLGGKARDKVRIYVHPDGGPTPEDYAEGFLKAQKAGWTGGKFGMLTKPNDIMDPEYAVRETAARVKAIREAVGDDFRICVDVHGKATTTMAVDFCKRVEEYRPFFVEEATQAEDLGELALLRSQTSVPLATGERHFSKYAFGEMCARHLVNYVQPDAIHCGGILEMRKIAALAEAFRIEVLPHNPNSRVCTFASLHFCVATPNATMLEIGGSERPKWDDLYFGTRVTYENGFALPPDKPGLGIDLDEAEAAKRPYVEKDWHGPRFEDGSIHDR